MNELETLKQRIGELENRLRLIESAEKDSVLQNRGFLKTFTTEKDPSTTDAGFRRTITLTLSGDPESKQFVVPAYPSRWKKLKDGSEFYIPLYAYDARYD